MKRFALYMCLALAGFSLATCKRKTREVIFEMPYKTYIWIPYNDKVNIPYPVPGTVATNYLQQFASNGVSKDDVKSIRMKMMQYTIVEPADANFNFVGYIKISVLIPGELEQEVASRYSVPDSMSTLALDIPDKDLARYVMRDSLEMKAVVNLDQPMQQGVRVKSELLFEVRAEVLD